MAHALVLLHRYTIKLTKVSADTLGSTRTGNRDIQVLVTIHLEGASSPGRLAELTGAGRNTAGRALSRLESAGWTSRTPDPHDRRSVLIRLTPKGRRRIRAFMSGVSDLHVSEHSLVKEVLELIDFDPYRKDRVGTSDPYEAVAAITRAGAEYVEDVIVTLSRFGPHAASDRFTLALLYVRGAQRPGQLAEEIHFSPSGVSGVLTRLEDWGLVSRMRRQGPDDRRALIVTLTPRGRSAAEAMVDVCRQHSEEIAAALTLTLGATRSSAST